MKLKLLLRPESVGGYSVSVPGFPGCHSQGETLEEALANIREAAELWLEVAAERAEAAAVERQFSTTEARRHGEEDTRQNNC